MSQVLRQSTQVIVVIGPFVDVADAFTPETGITLGAADEAEALKANTSTTTDISAATWAAITGCDGYYALTLTTSHTDTVGPLTVMVNDDSVCLPVFARFQVIEEAAYDAMYAASADPKADINVASIDANAITATAIQDNAITAAKIATGAIDADAIAADAITAAKVAADVSAEIADAVWDEDATGHQTQGTFGQAIGDPVADANTIYKAVVTDAAGATVGVDIVAVQADADNIQTRLPAALLNGRMESNVAAISDDSAAADALETMLDGGGGNVLTLKQLNIVNSTGDAIVASSSGGNGHGINASGNGSGEGLKATGGATGHGIEAVGGASSGDGIRSSGTAGNGKGINALGQGSGEGLSATGGATGSGLRATGGATSGDGISAAANTSGNGISATGQDQGRGIQGVGAGAGAGLSVTGGSTGSGIEAFAGGGDKAGLEVVGSDDGAGISAAGGATGHGIDVTGGARGINVLAGAGAAVELQGTDGPGLRALGGTDYEGIVAQGNGGAAGLHIEGGATGHGIEAVGGGVGSGIHAEGGSAGNGMDAVGGGSGAFGLYVAGVDAPGAQFQGGASSAGIATSGGTSGPGLLAEGGATGHGIEAVGGGTSGDGLHLSVTSGVKLHSADFTGAVVDDAGNSASTFLTNRTEASDDHWAAAYLRFTSGALLGQVRKVTAYNGTTKFVTVDPAFTAEPAAAVTFDLVNE